jgi:DNA-binding LacI/PurR family transcriptional regulator
MSSKKNQITMKDVAERAGVSKQTVSAIINNKPGITAETTARVNTAIQDLGYRPYSLARSLRTGQTHTLALIVTDINNPSFSTIASAAEDIAHSFGYSLVLYNTHDDPEREANYLRTASQRWMDGVIFVATGDQMTSLEFLNQADIPTVAIDRIPMGYTGPSITLDNNKTGRIAAEHLLKLGHRRFAHISGPRKLLLARERLMGFENRLHESDIDPKCILRFEGNWSCASGYSAMQQFLLNPTRPSAVFAANDRMAIGAIQAAQDAGLRVPQDISIMGVDDIEVAAFQSPSLTTIRQSFIEMANLCVNLLIDILNGKEPSNNQLLIEPMLVERKSTM